MKTLALNGIIPLPGTPRSEAGAEADPMLLAIDVGNTLTDLGLFEGEKLLGSFKLKTNINKTIDEYRISFSSFLKDRGNPAISSVIISSVVPSLTDMFVSLSLSLLKIRPLIVGPGLKSGLKLKVDNPLEVGSDLVCDAVGGINKYGSSLFIADLGTGSKYLFIDKDGAFAGLSIAPGLTISLEALVEKTAALPEVSFVPPKKAMGKNTIDCMKSGLLYGEAYRAMGFFAAFQKEAGYPLKAILTGGNGEYLKELLPTFEYDEWLLLEGLRDIAKRNK